MLCINLLTQNRVRLIEGFKSALPPVVIGYEAIRHITEPSVFSDQATPHRYLLYCPVGAVPTHIFYWDYMYQFLILVISNSGHLDSRTQKKQIQSFLYSVSAHTVILFLYTLLTFYLCDSIIYKELKSCMVEIQDFHKKPWCPVKAFLLSEN